MGNLIQIRSRASLETPQNHDGYQRKHFILFVNCKMTKNTRSCIIIGGGLVGALCACFMAKRGYKVYVYEKREDLRVAKEIKGRSINLSLSHRGRTALRTIGLEVEVLKESVAMKGRFLHSTKGTLKSIPYDSVFQQCGFSVSRSFLNKKLLEACFNYVILAAESYPNVQLYFNHRLIESDFNEGTVTFLNIGTSETITSKADLIIGADGAHSKLRSLMQHTQLFQFSQQYIEHGYVEFTIPPEKNDEMAPNHLHIWPREEFMMIALPNKDNSWTVTLFMPFKIFEGLTDEKTIAEFFYNTFPDVVELIGEEIIVEKLTKDKPSSLISVKCDPFHMAGKFVLVGDAAHAMVPFYGQGMNCGFEDCSILNELLDRNKDDIKRTLEDFSGSRVKNAHIICDLAMYNYTEMRHLVSTSSFRFRKFMDETLFRLFPTVWIPLYYSISYSDMEYSKCLRNKLWQDNMLFGFLIILGIGLLLYLYRYAVEIF